jgi:hypothetical protein
MSTFLLLRIRIAERFSLPASVLPALSRSAFSALTFRVFVELDLGDLVSSWLNQILAIACPSLKTRLWFCFCSAFSFYFRTRPWTSQVRVSQWVGPLGRVVLVHWFASLDSAYSPVPLIICCEQSSRNTGRATQAGSIDPRRCTRRITSPVSYRR